MIAETKLSRPRRRRTRARAERIPAWHAVFLRMLPAIRKRARMAFRHLNPDAREEAVQEVTASATVAFKELWDQDWAEVAYPSVLARYAVQQAKVGRRVGTRLNVRDVSSDYCQIQKGIAMHRLDHYGREQDGWLEVLVEDRRAGPAETAASRIDFPAWLRTLSRRKRRIAWKLALGETTGNVARRFGISSGRVSQLRRELERSWLRFHGELAVA